MLFTLMLDGWENVEAVGDCREFGSSGVNRVGRPLVILDTLIMLGYFFLQPHSAPGSLGKDSTHWNGREVNWWISCDWELIDVHGNLAKFMVQQPQKEQACTRKLRFFFGLLNCCYNSWNALLKTHEWAFEFYCRPMSVFLYRSRLYFRSISVVYYRTGSSF